MKSSTGKYYIGLDHVRGVAAFIVFTWHFIHIHDGKLAGAPIFPLSILMEGHTGVALFMVLSGYLFAKLLDGKQVRYIPFMWNRVLRLAPLLLLVCAIAWYRQWRMGTDPMEYGRTLLAGVVYPSLPNGGWSITVETHFYLILPLLLFLTRRWAYAPLLVVAAAIAYRFHLHHVNGEVQKLAYWTIVGRVDQFTLGILAFHMRNRIKGQHILGGTVIALFLGFIWYFDSLGGFYMNPEYPSPSRLWIIMPTVEGLAYAIIVAWYDQSFTHSTGPVSRFIALIGTLSYSIYLLHFFFVMEMARLVDLYMLDLSNRYYAMMMAVPSFLLILPIAYISYRFLETPFLRFRRSYIVKTPEELAARAKADAEAKAELAAAGADAESAPKA